MLYLSDAAEGTGEAALSTLRGWLAAINRVHLEAGHRPPGDDPAMTMFLRGLSRAVAPTGQATPVSALRIGEVRDICRMLDADEVAPAEVRDRALLLLHEAQITDGQLSRMKWEDVTITERILRVRIRPTRAGAPQRIETIKRRGGAVWAGSALQHWARIAGTTPAPVFTLVDHAGHRTEKPLTTKHISAIRRSRVSSLGRGRDKIEDINLAIGLLAGKPSQVLRDKAILLLGFAGAFRRNEICGLRWSDITPSSGGAVVHLRRSKTDQEGRGRDVGIPHGKSTLTCPITALNTWRARCEQQLGAETVRNMPCFVTVGRAGRIGTGPLTPEAVTRLVRRRAEQAHLDGRWGGRSLRAGFISTAADLDIPLESIARQSRHATLDSLIRYIRSDDPFRRNPAGRVGL